MLWGFKTHLITTAADKACPRKRLKRLLSSWTMASIGHRLCRAKALLPRTAFFSAVRSGPPKRCLATSACLRYQGTSSRSQLPEIPADKYQRTTITEDVQHAAAQQSWNDPRAENKVNLDKSSGESMIDPTIRHFTVNFVPYPFGL